MIRKNAQFAHAVQLRKRGFTYEEIAKIVDVSKSTVSLWLARESWSQGVTATNRKRAAKDNGKRIALLNKARGNQFKRLYAEAERSAVTEFKHYKHNPLFIAGVTLYMTIGDMRETHPIRLTSSKKEMHRLFIRFAREYLGVPREKIRFWLLLYPDLKPGVCTRAWATTLKLPLPQFHKHQIIEKRSTVRTLHDGVGNTIIGGTVSKRKLLMWIKLALKEL